MRTRNMIVAACVAALMMGAPTVQAAVITAGEADFAFEGNDVPPGGGWDSLLDTQTGSGWTVTDTATGGIWSRNVVDTAPTSTQYAYALKNNVINSLTFTIDWRVARPVTTENTVFQAGGPELDFRADIDGPGGSTDSRRLIFAIGDATTFGNSANKDIVTATGLAGKTQTDGIFGLNVDNFNIYRVVGLGDGSYKVYLNGVAAPIHTGTMMATAASGSAGQLGLGWQVGLQSGTLDLDMQTDYVRVLSGTARDEAPLDYSFAYEGNDVPPGGGWDAFVDTQTGATGYTVTDTAVGGVWSRNLVVNTSPLTQLMFAQKNNVINSLTFTIDWLVARPVTTENTMFQADGPYLDLQADIDGPGGSTDARRLVFHIGDATTFGDSANKDIIKHYDLAGNNTTDGIPSLNVDNFNLYRIVGLGDGTYKIYMNDVAAPIRTGTMAATAPSGSAGVLYTGWQMGRPSGTLEIDFQTDYIRVRSGIAHDEAPILLKGTLIVIK